MPAKPLSGMGAKPLNQLSGMPQMSAAFSGWTTSLDITKITQTIVNNLVQETYTNLNINGVWQPLSPKQIALKPEGERAWSWFMLHVEGNSVPLEVNDKVMFGGQKYKVMNRHDYELNNYVQLDLVLDFQQTT